MTQFTGKDKILSLYELGQHIHSVIRQSFGGRYYWVKGEIHKLNYYQYSGHAYPELLEKKDNEVVCQMRGIIWRNDLMRIQQNFQATLGEKLKDNIYVLMLVSVQYDPKYGFSLQIKDIDPNYTLGNLLKQKQQTIDRLKKEGLFEENKKLTLNPVPQKLAIISVETSKGFRDLITTFQKFGNRYDIKYQLFPSLLQGDEAASQIKNILQHIQKNFKDFDAVLIIRGGGGEVGLACYNDYELCKTIAQCPIPVITGIGHSTNMTVAEMVAYYNGITPTDVANFIIEKFQNFENRVLEAKNILENIIYDYSTHQKNHLHQLSQHLYHTVKQKIAFRQIKLNNLQVRLLSIPRMYFPEQQRKIFHQSNKLKFLAEWIIKEENKRLKNSQKMILAGSGKFIRQQQTYLSGALHLMMQKTIKSVKQQEKNLLSMEKQVKFLDPGNILKRGYALIYDENRKLVKSAGQISGQKDILIRLYQTEIEAKIQTYNIKNYEP